MTVITSIVGFFLQCPCALEYLGEFGVLSLFSCYCYIFDFHARQCATLKFNFFNYVLVNLLKMRYKVYRKYTEANQIRSQNDDVLPYI